MSKLWIEEEVTMSRNPKNPLRPLLEEGVGSGYVSKVVTSAKPALDLVLMPVETG